jgi:hypothetical protein
MAANLQTVNVDGSSVGALLDEARGRGLKLNERAAVESSMMQRASRHHHIDMGKVVGFAAALFGLLALTHCGDDGSPGGPGSGGSGADGGVGAAAQAGEGSDAGGSNGKGGSSRGEGGAAGSSEMTAGAPPEGMGGAGSGNAGAPGSDGGMPGSSSDGGAAGNDGGMPTGSDGGSNGEDGGAPSGTGGSPDPGPSTLYLFDGGGKAGALGGRAGADAVCQAAVASHSALGLTSVRAFLSVNASDEIRDMPVSYGFPTGVPIHGPTGVKIADDWADLLDGSVDATLTAAQALATDYFYTGSGSDGALDVHNCSGWTDSGTLFDGHYGSSYFTDARWVATGDATCGLTQYHVLCLGW